MADRLGMTIHVSIKEEDRTEFSGPAGAVIFIPFTGTVEGELFEGLVRPGGVDCQRVNQAGVKHMCARYVLEGTDQTGEHCYIFVENNGWFTSGTSNGFDTVPTFLTDSKALAPYLHRMAFRGHGEPCPGGVTIRMYEIEGV